MLYWQTILQQQVIQGFECRIVAFGGEMAEYCAALNAPNPESESDL